MKLEIKSLKVARFASEETLCFTARAYVDGKQFAHLNNDGHGGETEMHCGADDALYKKVIDEHGRELSNKARADYETWCREHDLQVKPEPTYDHLSDADKRREAHRALVYLLDHLVERLDGQRDVKRWHKKGIVFRDGDEIGTYGYKTSIAKMVQANKDDETRDYHEHDLRSRLADQLRAERPNAKIVVPDPLAGAMVFPV